MNDLEWGKTVNGWRLSLSLDKKIFVPEEKILITFVFENISDQTLQYGAQGKDFDYILNCKNEAGEEVPLSVFGQRRKANRGMGRYIVSELKPKQNLVAEVSLTRHLDMTLSGKYTLTVSREIFPHQGRNDPPVISNTVTFEIRE